MIINKTPVSFAGRVPSPRFIPVGVVGDNLVECVEFRLPTIADRQTATILLNGRYADAITLEHKGDIYCADITADIAGASGRLEGYIRINGEDGAVWNSEPFFLCVCDTPDINSKVEEYALTVFDQMLNAIAAHNVQMDEQTEVVNDLVADAQEAEWNAADSKAEAQASADVAANSASRSARSATDAGVSANQSALSAENAANSAGAAAQSAERAAEAVTSSGYVFFDIDDAGHLIMTKTDNVEGLDFRLTDGRLEVVYG